MSVVHHPSATKRFADIAERFQRAVKQADASRNIQQLGILAQFEDDELRIIKSYLCDNDHRLLKLAGRKIKL